MKQSYRIAIFVFLLSLTVGSSSGEITPSQICGDSTEVKDGIKVNISTGSFFVPKDFELIVDLTRSNIVKLSGFVDELIGHVTISRVESCPICSDSLDLKDSQVEFYRERYNLIYLSHNERNIVLLENKTEWRRGEISSVYIYDDSTAIKVVSANEQLWCGILGTLE